jgi:hypothetical protein
MVTPTTPEPLHHSKSQVLSPDPAPRSKAQLLMEQVDCISVISKAMAESSKKRDELIDAKLNRAKLTNLAILMDTGVISADEYREKAIKFLE